MIVDQNEELADFRAEVRAFVQESLPVDIKRKGRLGLKMVKDDHVRWQKILREKGWFAAAWPEALGGAGWGLERQLVFLQEAALNNAPLIIPYGVNMVGPVLYTFGSDEQRERFLPGILSSDTWWCQGYSEPNSGSDLASLKTFAERDGDDYVVNGTKMWTTEAHWADWMHCLVRTTREGKPQKGISFLLIDMNTPGIDIKPIVTIDGIHHTNQIFLDNVRVPAENLVGEEGGGWTIAKFLLANERVAIADTGPKLKLFEHLTRTYQTYCDNGMLSQTSRLTLSIRLNKLQARLRALCAMERQYINAWAGGASTNGPEASILKICGTECLQDMSELGVELQGLLGQVHDPRDLYGAGGETLSALQHASALAHEYLYSRCWSIFGGTNEIQRNIIAKTILS